MGYQAIDSPYVVRRLCGVMPDKNKSNRGPASPAKTNSNRGTASPAKNNSNRGPASPAKNKSNRNSASPAKNNSNRGPASPAGKQTIGVRLTRLTNSDILYSNQFRR